MGPFYQARVFPSKAAVFVLEPANSIRKRPLGHRRLDGDVYSPLDGEVPLGARHFAPTGRTVGTGYGSLPPL